MVDVSGEDACQFFSPVDVTDAFDHEVVGFGGWGFEVWCADGDDVDVACWVDGGFGGVRGGTVGGGDAGAFEEFAV